LHQSVSGHTEITQQPVQSW